MKNKIYLKKYLIQAFLTILIFSFAFLIIHKLEYKKYNENFNSKINAIINELQEEYPNISKDDIVDILSSNKIEENLLKEYGYDINNDSYIANNDILFLIFNILTIISFIISFLSMIYIFLKYTSSHDKEVNKIIKTIEDINHKNYKLNLDDLSEDNLSILKQEIYKTTIMLKENAENSLIDKIKLKNSLQDISHQLKTPLTSINILLDNIIEDESMDNETREKFIQKIKREILNITFLIQSILKLSKFEANSIEFIKEEVSIERVIKESIKNVSSLCDLKNVEIKIENLKEGIITCDLNWQVEALTNILKNAVEYSDENSKVIIDCEDNSLYTQIKIIDFGHGMDEEDQLNIFKRFYKGKNSTKDSIGIGLSLAKVIIEQDNGRVIVESEKGKGTTFIIKYFK